jgi:hypothetical protein
VIFIFYSSKTKLYPFLHHFLRIWTINILIQMDKYLSISLHPKFLSIVIKHQIFIRSQRWHINFHYNRKLSCIYVCTSTSFPQVIHLFKSFNRLARDISKKNNNKSDSNRLASIKPSLGLAFRFQSINGDMLTSTNRKFSCIYAPVDHFPR